MTLVPLSFPSHFHQYRMYWTNSKELLGIKQWFIQYRVTSQNNQDVCRIASWVNFLYFYFFHLVHRPLFVWLSLTLYRMFCFSNLLYFYPVESTGSFFCICWFYTLKIKVKSKGTKSTLSQAGQAKFIQQSFLFKKNKPKWIHRFWQGCDIHLPTLCQRQKSRPKD